MVGLKGEKNGILNVLFGSKKLSCNELLFWLDHGESAGHMTYIIHSFPEGGALILSGSVNFQLILEIPQI